MSRGRQALFLAAWLALATAVIAAAAWLADSLLVSVIAGLIAALLVGGSSLILARTILGMGMIDNQAVQRLAGELLKARAGDLTVAWDDITLIQNGQEVVIPFQEVHDRLVGVLGEADRMSHQLNRLAQEILDQAATLSQGALDQQASVAASTSSIGRIDQSTHRVVSGVESLADLGENVSSSTYQMIASIEEVSRTAQSLNQIINETVSAIQETVNSIHGVSESAQSLSGASVQTRESMEKIDRATRQIRDRAEETAALAKDAREGTQHSKDLLARTVQSIHALSEKMESIRELMHQLGIQSRSIGEILTVISSVASDTHLLSLNASIMAAKAGEHGRGFSVVAQEIKILANRTSESATEIEKLILATQERVDHAVRAIEEGAAMAGDGRRVSEEADRSLADVLTRAEVAARNADDIARDTYAQAEMSEQVFRAVEEVAKRTQLIRGAMKDQEESSEYIRGRSIQTQELMNQVSQAMIDQGEANRLISQSMDRLTASIQDIRFATEDQAKSSAGIVTAIDTIRKKADLVAISAHYVSNTSMSVLNQSLLLRHEIKGLELPERASRMVLGLLFDNLREERWRRDRESFETKAAELGARIESRVAEGDHRRQETQAQELLDLGAELIILVAVDAEAAGRIVDRAKARGVPAIAYHRLVRNCRLELFVSLDVTMVGEFQARTALLKAKGNRILMLLGSSKDLNAHHLYAGQMKVIKPALDRGEVVMVDQVWVPDWDPEQARQLVREVIQKKGPVDAVVASNDGTAGGAIRAVAELLPGRPVVITGMDADLTACQRIVQGSQAMTAYLPVKLQATRTVEAALLMFRGENIPGITDYVDNGTVKAPSILLKPIMVDADNMEEVIIKDGYHSREEIYS